jgi:hypothetical protein
MSTNPRSSYLSFAVTTLLLLSTPATAQEIGHYIQGVAGLDSGSQPPPGLFFTYLPYIYYVDSLKGRNGNTLVNTNLTFTIHNAVITAVTPTKFLGADYGFSFAVPVVNQRLVNDILPSGSVSKAGVSDIFFEPLMLGWQKSRADIRFTYGFYAPTGDYNSENLSNVGLGFFENQLQLGSTFHLDQAKMLNASFLTTWEINQQKSGENIKPGEMFTLEYGLGKKFLKGGLNLGVSGYYYRKLIADSGADINPIQRGIHDQALGLGPEAQLTLPVKPPFFAQLIVRYQPQFEVIGRPHGQVLTIAFSIIDLFANQ